MDNYLVSIVIPCYNASEYIEQCMKSVLDNYIDGMHVVIINNGSTDDTLEKCQQYRKYSFVTIIDQENKGHCGSKNAGMNAALGKYVMFIDVDDEWLPGAISKAVTKMEETSADVLCFGYRQSTERNGVVVKEKDYLPTEDYRCGNAEEVFNRLFYGIFGIPIEAIENWYKGNKIDRHKRFSSLWCHVYKREILEELGLRLNEKLLMYEDGIFNCEYYLRCRTSDYIPESLYLYKKRDTGITITKYDRAKVDLKMPLLEERNRLRKKVFEEKGIDILPWYAGSNVLSIFQMMNNYAQLKDHRNAIPEIKAYIFTNAVRDSIELYPVGGTLKQRIPAWLLRNGHVELLFNLVCAANALGIGLNV